jgi:hypothetical protein
MWNLCENFGDIKVIIRIFFFSWPLCCLSFCSFSFDHCVVCHFVLFPQWTKEKEQNDRQHNGQEKKNKMTDKAMAKRKRTK